MSEVKLLPLPEPGEAMSKWAYHETEMESYARANMEPLIDEIEALRAEVAEARDGWHMANGVAELAMKHRDAAEARAERLAEALRIAEAALADIGDADREPGDDVAWCERRAAQALPTARAALDQEGGNG